MPTKATAGLKPCATTGEPNGNNDGGCGLCPASADGYDAAYGGALCAECADAFGALQSDLREVRDE
ncbi:hypothetical protein [Halorubrum aidingense]|uniref:hypothetical protein n=1 Tax=Halorubrum aidingense TaxID=368623 RepID=UPI000AF1D825|nr:hypothetical protein [Halorubrum aidingense]